MKRINIGIIFGGKSAEHEVSLQSARSVYNAIDKNKYNPVLIGIDKSGKWLLPDQANFLINENNPKLIGLNKSGDAVALVPESGGALSILGGHTAEQSIDVAFPVLHGPNGEDGTVQGLLKLANIPFVGAGVLGSAVGMDKDVMKRLLRDAGIPIAKFVTLYSDDDLPSFNSITQALGNPVFIKPANMGSSVGVSKATNEAEYFAAAAEAFKYDSKLLVEEFVAGREIECAVLGNSKPIVSVPGELRPTHDFYTYEAKYIDSAGALFDIPARLSPEAATQAQALAIKTFKTLCCEGLGRVDMFYKESGEILVNEINTLPGFTSISMYPKLWEASGIGYADLIDRLITLALERFEKEKTRQSNYS
jgi:D-alanine-D-alanine ligase